MSEHERPIDDLDAYIATLSDSEREELAVASEALDIAHLLYHARLHRGLTQAEAAAKAGLQQQAISRLERAATNMTIATLQGYLRELGYTVEISLRDADSGKLVAKVSTPGKRTVTAGTPIRRPPTRVPATR